MSGYSLSDSAAAMAGVSAENTTHSSDSLPSLAAHTYHHHHHHHQHQQQQQQQQQQQPQQNDGHYHHHSHSTSGPDNSHSAVMRTSLAGNTSATLNHALAEIDTTPVDENAFADYFFKQQVLGLDSASQVTSSGDYRGNGGLNPQATASLEDPHSYHQGQSDITAAAAAAAAVVAAATSANPSHSELQSSPVFSHRPPPPPPPPGYHSQNATNDDSSHYSPTASAAMASVPASSTNNTTNQHPYHPHHQDRNNNNSGGDGGGGTGATSASSCLVDPLPSFLSSLPLPNSLESSKYPSMVSVAGGAHNRSTEEATMASGNSDIFSAAAAVAAAASGTHSHQYHGQHMSHSGMHSQPQTSAHHPSYDTSSLAFTQSNPGTTAGLSSQDAAAAAAAAAAVLANNTGSTTSPLDLNAYSISAFSRPLSQSSSTAAVLLGNENTGSTTPGRESLSSYSFGGSSLSGALQPTTGILSPQQQHQQHQQHRSYSDYSAYYRSPSTALGVTSSSAPGTGSSTSSALAAGSGVGANGGQFSSSVGMGQTPYYQQTTYQQYMRSGSTHPYYYSQIPSRYVPYGACPPIRHFVSPARPFKCPTCEQSFSRNHDLKRHVKIHSGIKPHRCPKCGKSFGRSDALKRHSMVKRCRSSTTIAASSTTAAPVSQSTGMHGQSSQHTVMTSVPSSSRLASSATGSMFGQSAAPGMSNNTSSIVSSMLSSRTNAI